LSRITVAQLIAENDGLCVLTEGEFKVGRSLPVPQSQQSRARVSRSLPIPHSSVSCSASSTSSVSQISSIIYDNEVKDDPAFPRSSRRDPWKRYDNRRLGRSMPSASCAISSFASTAPSKVGHLPDQ
jgi:hypothetical protein